jgi:hypothetical protein
LRKAARESRPDPVATASRQPPATQPSGLTAPRVSQFSAILAAIDDGESGLEKLEALLVAKPLDARTLLQLADQLKAIGRSQRQQHAANQKHATNKEAKAYAIEQFAIHRGRFRSKAAFARYLVGKIKTKFKLTVKYETICRDWLPSTTSVYVAGTAIAYSGGQYVLAKPKRK